MKKFFPLIIIVIAALAFLPTMLLAKDEGHHHGQQAQSAGDPAGKMKGHEQWAAEHKNLQDQISAMDQRLDQMVAAMNSAAGDQKIAAMSDVINELVAQRKQMVEMFKTYHAKMRERMMMMHKPCDDCAKHGKMKKGSHPEEKSPGGTSQ